MSIAFFSVDVSACCPTTVAKVVGLYFRADTMYFSMIRFIVGNFSPQSANIRRIFDEKNSESRPEAGSRWQSQFFEANIGKISLLSKSGRSTSRRIVFLLFLLFVQR